MLSIHLFHLFIKKSYTNQWKEEKMLSFYVIGIQVKSFGRKPVAQYHLVQILFIFFRFLDYCVGRILWCQIVENENLKPQVKVPL